MRVINLLPWREALYRKRRRNFALALLSLTTAGSAWAAISHHANVQNRMGYDSHVTHLQTALSHLELDNVLLQHSLHELAEHNEQLQSRIIQWQQQRQWQQLMSEWQLLAEGAQISDITWQGNELLLSGFSDAADPLRRLIDGSPQWQLEEIELNAQTRFRFVVSRALQMKEGI